MEERIKIWGDSIPYNTGRSKLEVMDIHPEYRQLEILLKHPGIFNKKVEFTEDMSGNDTMVYNTEIKTGIARETFDDEPYLIPYIVPGSDRCILSVPGGGYLNKSMDNEGMGIARFLNKAGISCFVLWYRSYPYLYPVPTLDLQRAVRYVRYHANDYGIDSRKIGMVGFSAGGNCCGNLLNLLRNAPVDYPGYSEDEIDRMDATVALAGLVYPAIDLENYKVFMGAYIDRNELRDATKREKLAREFTIKYHIEPDDPPQFICHARNDFLVPFQGSVDYFNALVAKGVPAKFLDLKKGNHGFGACENKSWWARSGQGYASRWRDEFSNWANNIFDEVG